MVLMKGVRDNGLYSLEAKTSNHPVVASSEVVVSKSEVEHRRLAGISVVNACSCCVVLLEVAAERLEFSLVFCKWCGIHYWKCRKVKRLRKPALVLGTLVSRW